MSILFFVNNFNFALLLMGAVALLLTAWLSFDTYSVRKDALTLSRAAGLFCVAISYALFAFSLQNDLLSYFGSVLYIVGLFAVLVSFLQQKKLAANAVVVIPAFAVWSTTLGLIEGVLLIAIAYFSYVRGKEEFNKTWTPFSLGFALVGVGAFIEILAYGNLTSVYSMGGHVVTFIGFILLIKWVWQFLQLRIQESMVIVLISAALFLSTVVTLAFSTILIGRITLETESSLLTDARVLDLYVQTLQEESLVKTSLISYDVTLAPAVIDSDFSALEKAAEGYMEAYKLGFVTITDIEGTVLVRAHALSRRGDSLLGERSFEEAHAGNSFVTIEQSPVEKLSIRAGAPIFLKGKVVGVVIAGYPLDNALVDRIKRITGLDMFMYEGEISVATTAFAKDGRTRVVGIPISNSQVNADVLLGGNTITTRVELMGQAFHASFLPLKNEDGKILGMLSAAKPEQDVLDIINATNRLTLVTVIIIMLLAAYPIYAFTRRLGNEV